MLVIYTGRSDDFLRNFHLIMSRTLSSCCFYSYASPNTKGHIPVNSKKEFSNITLLNKAWRAKYCIDSKRSPIGRLSWNGSCRIMRWKSTRVFSSVAGHHCMTHQAHSNAPWFKGLPPSCSFFPQAVVSFTIYPLLCVNFPLFMLLQCFGRRVARHKRFSSADAAYFSISALRKCHQVLWGLKTRV